MGKIGPIHCSSASSSTLPPSNSIYFSCILLDLSLPPSLSVLHINLSHFALLNSDHSKLQALNKMAWDKQAELDLILILLDAAKMDTHNWDAVAAKMRAKGHKVTGNAARCVKSHAFFSFLALALFSFPLSSPQCYIRPMLQLLDNLTSPSSVHKPVSPFRNTY